MKTDISRLRKLLRENESSRLEYLQGILQEENPMRIGSLVTVRRKCGKPNCRCAEGEGHLSTYLSTKEEGKTRMVYIPAVCLDTVTQQTRTYRRFRNNRAALVKLAQQSLLLIDRLQRMLQITKGASLKEKKKQRKN